MRFEIDLSDVDTYLTAYLDKYDHNTYHATYEIRFLGVHVQTITGDLVDEKDAIYESGAAKKAEALIKRLWSETP
jgi:hypothetical protein